MTSAGPPSRPDGRMSQAKRRLRTTSGPICQMLWPSPRVYALPYQSSWPCEVRNPRNASAKYGGTQGANSPSIAAGSGAGSVRQRSRRRSRSKPPMRSKVHVLSVVAIASPRSVGQAYGDGASVGATARDEGSDVAFEERIDPELRDGLVLYQALGFEAEDLSGETLATMRTTSA